MAVRYCTLEQSPTMKSLKRVKLRKLLIWFSKLRLFHLLTLTHMTSAIQFINEKGQCLYCVPLLCQIKTVACWYAY